jgi:hypothetical protein
LPTSGGFPHRRRIRGSQDHTNPVTTKIIITIMQSFKRCKNEGKERIHLLFPPREGGLLRLSRAFSATLAGRFRRMGAEGGTGTKRLILTQHSPYL